MTRKTSIRLQGLAVLVMASGLTLLAVAMIPTQAASQPTVAEFAQTNPQVSVASEAIGWPDTTRAVTTRAVAATPTIAPPPPPPPVVETPEDRSEESSGTTPGTSPTGPQTITLSPKTALGDQGVIDQGYLVTWMTDPTCLLAGHDTDGWYWMSSVPVGTIIEVVTGPCVGQFEITGHQGHNWRGGAIPDWMAGHDLILQTCTEQGTGFSLARRIG